MDKEWHRECGQFCHRWALVFLDHVFLLYSTDFTVTWAYHADNTSGSENNSFFLRKLGSLRSLTNSRPMLGVGPTLNQGE
jgi:hypothetical protein